MKGPSYRWRFPGFLAAGLALVLPISCKPKPAANESTSPPDVSFLPLQKEGEAPFSFGRNSSHEWGFSLASRPILARLEGEIFHSGFNAPLRLAINGQDAGILHVNLPSLREGPYRFFRAPRTGSTEGFTYVADANRWVSAWAFLERPYFLEGTNRIRLSSTLDQVRVRNLRLEILTELPKQGAFDLASGSEFTPLEAGPLVLPPLVTLEDGTWKSVPPPRGLKHTALYFSAHWCGPCRVFTPKLVEWYRQMRSQHKDFELVFVSSDRSAEAMLSYMKEADMPWPAIPFDQIQASGVKKWSARGIPYLIVFGPDGRPLTAKDRSWRSPNQVMQEAEAILAGRPVPKETP